MSSVSHKVGTHIFVVLTAAPADVLLLPPVASALIAAFLAELLLAVVAAAEAADAVALAVAEVPVVEELDELEAEELDAGTTPNVVGAVTVPPGAFDVCVPEAPPPEVAT